MSPRLPAVWLLTSMTLAGGGSVVEGQAVQAGGTLSVFQVSSEATQGPEQIQLWTTPVSAGWTTPWLSVDVQGAFADAIVTYRDGTYSRRSAPSDLRISATIPVRVFSFTGLASIPVGDNTLSVDEIPVAGVTASELLPLGVNGWGSGGSVGGSVEASGYLGINRLRLSGTFLRSAAYRPFEGPGPLYEPGTQIRGRLVVDWPVGRAGTLTTLVGHRHAFDDVYDDSELLRAGGRFEGAATYSHAVGGQEALSLYARYSRRTDAQLLPRTDLVAGRQLPGIVTPQARNLMVTGLELSVSRRRLSVVPSAELRLLGTADGVGGGWLAAAGGEAAYRLGGRHTRPLTATASLRLMAGGFDEAGGSRAGLTGFELSAGMRWGGR